MKKIFTLLLLLFFLIIFGGINYKNNYSSEVLQILTPTKFDIDTNKNGIIDNNETFCIPDIEVLNTKDNKKQMLQNLKLSDIDGINIGYLGEEFAKKTLLNKKVKIKKTKQIINGCQYAEIYINNVKYKDMLIQNGFGISDNNIINKDKFKELIEQGKKLNLVIYNHKSNKYHKLNCEYGKIAHDKILIPYKQLPKEAIPCNFCHNKNNKSPKKINKLPITSTPYINTTLLAENIKIYILDMTKTLRPNSNCSTHACKALLENINNAKESIDMALYGYDENNAITNALKQAKNRGVNIRFVYDAVSNPANAFYPNTSIIVDIANESKGDNAGREVDKLMHNKFVIFDKKIVYTGSMNFSNTGFSGFDGNDVIIIDSEEIADLYTKEFEQMLNGKFHSAKQRNSGKHSFKIGNSNIEVLFSPKYNTPTRIIQIINKSHKYIYIPTFLITHRNITEALINAHNRGVDVKIIMDAANTSTTHIKYEQIRKKGIPLKIENYAGKLHSKTMIIDDEYLIMGSMNFSNSGDKNNDENTLIIKNSDLSQGYKEFFQYLWNIIPDKYLKFNPPAESFESIGSCSDGVDNNFNGLIDSKEEKCKK